MFAVKFLSISRGIASSFSRSFASSNNVIFVLGAPGSGKGKHSDNLVAKFGGCHVSVGEILREVRIFPSLYSVDGQDSRKVHRNDQEAHERTCCSTRLKCRKEHWFPLKLPWNSLRTRSWARRMEFYFWMAILATCLTTKYQFVFTTHWHRLGVISWEIVAMCLVVCCTSAATSFWRSVWLLEEKTRMHLLQYDNLCSNVVAVVRMTIWRWLRDVSTAMSMKRRRC